MNRSNENGIAMILAMFMVLIMSTLGVSLMFTSQTETWSSQNYKMMSQARYAAESGVQAAAKTGTAQLNTTGPERSNGWIIGFAPAEAPQYAVAVVLKGGPDDEISAGTGGKLAGPIAKQVLDYLLAHPTGP